MPQTKATAPAVSGSGLLAYQIEPLRAIGPDDLNEIYVFHKPGISPDFPKGYVSHFSAASAGHEGFSLRDYFIQSGLDRHYPLEEMICFGRLDKDTSGLLVLSKRNKHPKFIDQLLLNPNFKKQGAPISKVYRARVKGEVDGKKLSGARRIKIPSKNAGWLEARVESAQLVSVSEEEHARKSSLVQIEINEGIHHQVKKMFYALGHPVHRGGLHRIKFGILTLAASEKSASEMKPGAIRKLFLSEKRWLVETYNNWLEIEKLTRLSD